MATVLAPGIYQLSPLEGLGIQISAAGTGYLVIAGIDNIILDFPSSGSAVAITPQMLNGLGAHHTLDIRSVFTAGATKQAEYLIEVFDQNGSQMDAIRRPVDPNRLKPYQTLTQLNLIVQ